MENKNLIRDYYVGSEWLYYKIYIGTNTADIFLTDFQKVAKYLLESEIIDNFFFIRYEDPDFHLRIRFKVSDIDLILKVINAMSNLVRRYFEEHTIFKIQIDTYNREIERYGIDTIELSEELFFIDSKIVLEILSYNENSSINGNEVWFNALKIIDFYLDVFSFDLRNKEAFIKDLAEGFSEEFSVSSVGKKQLALKYRSNRVKIEEVINTGFENNLVDTLEEMRNVASKIMSKADFDNGVIKYLLGSYLHMHCNRFFSSQPRMNEWLIYDFLSIYYKGQMAKGRNDIKVKEEAENLTE